MTTKQDLSPAMNLTSNGDEERLDSCADDDVSELCCPSLSANPEADRAITQKQDIFEKQPQTMSCEVSNKITPSLNRFHLWKRFQSRFTPFTGALLLAFVFRVILLLFATWQDQTRWPDGQLRFTDVDYDVFTDAARALVARNDIYEARPTYRYSPLIAAVLAPGHWLFGKKVPIPSAYPSSRDELESKATMLSTEEPHALARMWGKLVFILSDLLCAWLQYQIIQAESELHRQNQSDSTEASGDETPNRPRWAVWFITFGWLFNPVTAVVSVRGNAEAFLGVFVLLCLLLLLRRRLFLAGLVFGLCIHLKLYPVIYAPAIYLWLSNPPHQPTSTVDRPPLVGLLPSRKHVIFGLGTICSLGLLTLWGYVWFGGMRFLWQAYLYHFARVDIKHNFASHFYPLYLLSGSEWLVNKWTLATHRHSGLLARLHSTLVQFLSVQEPISSSDQLMLFFMKHVDLWSRLFNLICFLPTVVLIPTHSFKLYRHLGLCWFVITYVFVTFNKVCTSQYFLWSLFLLPIALSSMKLPASHSPVYAIVESLLVWFAAQAFWLASAYTLEMRTQSSEASATAVWRLVWFASLVFLGTNIMLIRRFIQWRRPCDCGIQSTAFSDDYITSDKKEQ